MDHNGARRKSGFSLIEAIVALFVLSIAAAAILPALIQAKKQEMHNRRVEVATRAAASELDAIRSSGYDRLPPIPSGKTSTTVFLKARSQDLPNMRTTLKVTNIDASLSPVTEDAERKRLDVTVDWNQPGVDKGSLTQTTVVASK